MNVTTSASWTRPPVGIVRVEQALCEELELKLGVTRFRRCIWNGRIFFDPQEIASTVAKKHIEPPPPPPRPSASSHQLSRMRKFTALLFGTESLCKHTAADEDEPEETTEPSDTVHDPFSAGDVLISIGLDWGQSYTPTLQALRKRKNIKIITCCYDLIPVLYPHYCVGDVARIFTEYFVDVAQGSDAILCISKQSENDLNTLLSNVGSPRPRTCVIRLGDNVPGTKGAISPAVMDLSKSPFILFVSTIERRKNHEVLYRAYHLLCAAGKRDSMPKLVFVGMPGWGVGDLLKDIEIDPLTQGLILQFHHVTDAELRFLYDTALFCVYPSLYEGWGLPVGEALSLGKVVLSSDRGSLREVGGSLVRYVDPWDTNAWADAVWNLVSDVHARELLEQRVREDYRPGTWAQTAEVVRKLIDELNSVPFEMRLNAGYDLSSQSGEHVGAFIRHCGRGGFLTFGPHRAIDAGTYYVEVYDVGSERVAGNGRFEVTSSEGKGIHWSYPINFSPVSATYSGALIGFCLTFDSPARDVEFRCVVESGSLTIGRIEVKSLDLRTQAAFVASDERAATFKPANLSAH